jgi:hypothetical protein
MRRVILTTILLLSATAFADDELSGGVHIQYNHRGQFQLYTQGGVGYRAIFTYNRNDYCGSAGTRVCTNLAPPFIEFGLAFAPTSSLELITDVRWGLAADFKPAGSTGDPPRQFAVAPGFRIYIDDAGSSKFFTTLQLALDFTDYSIDNNAKSIDVGVRNVNGLLLDLHRTFGVYLFVGETIGFLRWLRFEMDGGLGLQIRFP